MRHWLGMLCVILLGSLPLSAHAMSEGEVKAAYIYNFALFTECPERSGGEFTLCSLGTDAVVAHLPALSGKSVHGVGLQVKTLGSGESARHCHMLYIAASENVRAALVRASEGSTLTITDDGLGVASGVMITLQQEGSRIGFTINTSQIRQARLTLSSKLLKLARIVNY